MNGKAAERPSGVFRTNGNHKVLLLFKCVVGILGTLLVAAVISLVSTFRQTATAIKDLQTRQELMAEDVAENAKWIADWYSVLRVPERDQHQDSAIEELTRQYEETARRLRILERREGN